MKTQENYIYLLDGKKEVKVLWKKLDKVCVMEIGKDYPSAIVDVDRLSGIQITEEWMEKFGFERQENNWKTLNLHFATISWERLAGIALSFENESIYLPHIKYVHQLQILYHSLTNNEL